MTFKNLQSFTLVITGPMGSGKTTELFRQLERVEIAGGKTVLFKPLLDNRSEGVRTHMGFERKAVSLEKAERIFDFVDSSIAAVGIEEAQFFDDTICEVVRKLVRQGQKVFVAGLDLDFMGRPFGPMPRLLAYAEYVIKLQAVCRICGQDASRVARKTSENGQVLVGGMDVYQPVCTKCHEKWLSEQAG